MKCVQCGRRGTPNRVNCMYCGGKIDKSFVDESIDCPGCGDRMEKTEISGTLVDICPSCQGSWFDFGELEKVLKKVEILFEPEKEIQTKKCTPQAQNYRECPRCAAFMLMKNYKRYSGVVVDICGFHGIYLDAKEFERIATFVQNGGLEKSSERHNIEEKHSREFTKAKQENILEKNMYPKNRRSYFTIFDFFDFIL